MPFIVWTWNSSRPWLIHKEHESLLWRACEEKRFYILFSHIGLFKDEHHWQKHKQARTCCAVSNSATQIEPKTLKKIENPETTISKVCMLLQIPTTTQVSTQTAYQTISFWDLKWAMGSPPQLTRAWVTQVYRSLVIFTHKKRSS